jgi:hypothetical protein
MNLKKGLRRIISFIVLLVNFLIIGLFIFGFIISKKRQFKAGVYSFLLLLIIQIYEYIAPFVIDSIIYNYYSTVMKMGEFVSLLSLIPKTIELLAITICYWFVQNVVSSKTAMSNFNYLTNGSESGTRSCRWQLLLCLRSSIV